MTDSPKNNDSSQRQRFIEAARAAEADEDEAAFKAQLAVIAKQKPRDAVRPPEPAKKGKRP